MTFLEFVCQTLMGPPVSGSCWHCPICDSSGPSFSVRPPKAGFPIKFKCFRCDAWGDEFDLAKLFYPREDFNARLQRLGLLRVEYAQRDVAAALADLRGDFHDEETNETFALQILSEAAVRCRNKDVPMEALVQYWHDIKAMQEAKVG
jgi:hypothetical protein